MLKCPNCGNALEDNDIFCNKCGVKIVKYFFCEKCGAELRNGASFCSACGAQLNENVPNKNQKKSAFIKLTKYIPYVLLVISLSMNIFLYRNNQYQSVSHNQTTNKTTMYFINDLGSDVLFTLSDEKGKVLIEDEMENKEIVKYDLLQKVYRAKYEITFGNYEYKYMDFHSSAYNNTFIYLSEM